MLLLLTICTVFLLLTVLVCRLTLYGSTSENACTVRFLGGKLLLCVKKTKHRQCVHGHVHVAAYCGWINTQILVVKDDYMDLVGTLAQSRSS